jgi:glyoxylase-like metal-dependent hydrolase (beta-lactamase superfamily II)
MTRMLPIALMVTALSGCTHLSPEQQIISDAATALGGRDRIEAVKTLVIEGEGTNGNLGQDMRPDATTQTFKVTAYKRAVDLAGHRWRVEQTRTPNFTYFQGPAPQRQVMGMDGEVAYNIAQNGTASRAANTVASDRRMEMYHHPVTIIRAALDPQAKLANPRTFENQRSVDITTANGVKLTLAIDAATKLPTRVVSMTDNPNLGDVAIETHFTDYQKVGEIQLPAHFVTTTDKYPTAELRVIKQTTDADTGDLTAPAAAASAAPITAPPPAVVTADKVADGIWLLAGQSHHSVLVEFSDHLALIEAPQNDTRSLAVIAKARELRPDKPLTTVINTHHHFDHSGGVRAAVSEGLSIVTHKDNAAFYQEAVARSHTIAPDALARNAKPLKIEQVDDAQEMKDATMTVNLYHIVGSSHADTLLMAYFPKERLLVEADVYTPGAAVAPYAANLLDNIKKRNLKVDRIVPIHGTAAPFADLVKTTQAAASN